MLYTRRLVPVHQMRRRDQRRDTDGHGPNCGKTTENGVFVAVVAVVAVVVVVVSVYEDGDCKRLRFEWANGKVQSCWSTELSTPQGWTPPQPKKRTRSRLAWQ